MSKACKGKRGNHRNKGPKGESTRESKQTCAPLATDPQQSQPVAQTVKRMRGTKKESQGAQHRSPCSKKRPPKGREPSRENIESTSTLNPRGSPRPASEAPAHSTSCNASRKKTFFGYGHRRGPLWYASSAYLACEPEASLTKKLRGASPSHAACYAAESRFHAHSLSRCALHNAPIRFKFPEKHVMNEVNGMFEGIPCRCWGGGCSTQNNGRKNTFWNI